MGLATTPYVQVQRWLFVAAQLGVIGVGECLTDLQINYRKGAVEQPC